jgi:tetratricopeptide (TPR) repeat protein
MLAHLLELGDRPALERERQTLERLAGLGEPKARALVASMRAAQAHLDGRLDRCEELAHEALALGLAEGSDEAAMQGFGSMIGSIRREQGRLGEMVEAIENFADHNPSITGWRCAQAYAYAELDRVEDARTVIAALAPNGFAAIPKDALWAIGIAQVCQAVHRIDDVASAAVLYDQLAPYADRCVVSLNLLSWGSVARTLGLLASTLGRHDVADAHFVHALQVNAAIGARLWVTRTNCDRAGALRRRGRPGDHERAAALEATVRATAAELGLTALAAAATR